ncbi:hypothetical protein EDF58_106496 [Novosphingobium sp. PhB57]|nr:hypothetical protein EDF58_106496 [Novosphingobium sp. PhB57]
MRDGTPENHVFRARFTCGITSPGAALCAAPWQDNRRESLGQGLTGSRRLCVLRTDIWAVVAAFQLEVKAYPAPMRTMTAIRLASSAVSVGIELGAVPRLPGPDRRMSHRARRVAIGIVDPAIRGGRGAAFRQQARRGIADVAGVQAEVPSASAYERSEHEPRADFADRCLPSPEKRALSKKPAVLNWNRSKRPVFCHRSSTPQFGPSSVRGRACKPGGRTWFCR